MPTVVQFAYGPVNPAAGFLLAFVGSLIGLGAAAQARRAKDKGRRMRWLLIASVAIGVGFWLMHFTAVLGFEVAGAPVHYDVPTTLASAVLAVVPVGLGVFLAGYGRRSAPRVLAGGVVTGLGLAGMHYTGMAAMRLSGTLFYDRTRLYASVAIAVLASIVALFFIVLVRGWWLRVLAAAVTGGAMTAMHYTAMSAVHVHLLDQVPPVSGINPIELVLPITIIAAAFLVTLVLTALAGMAEEGRSPIPAPDPAPGQHYFGVLMRGDEPAFRPLPARLEGRPMTINGFATPRPERLPRSRRL